jgi:hypothetical protein
MSILSPGILMGNGGGEGDAAALAAANAALAAAQTAQTTAGTAKNTADAAQTAADTAQDTAETAQTAAETAQTAAETAQTAAGTAQTAAETAQTAAGAANTAAGAAKTAAETAQTAAETAQTTAETAQTTAESAQSAADAAAGLAAIALGNYQAVEDEFNLNGQHEAAKLYLLDPLNAPAGAPCFLAVGMDSDVSASFQACWSAAAPGDVWVRAGALTVSGQDVSVVWDTWKPAAGARIDQAESDANAYTDAEIAKLPRTFAEKGTFIGFYASSPSEAAGAADGDKALKADGTKVASYQGGWTEADLAPETLDLWYDSSEDREYYWAHGAWNRLDFDTDMSLKEDVANKVQTVAAAATASAAKYPSEKAVRSAVDTVAGNIPDVSGKQDKIAAGAGKIVWGSATAGTVTLTAPATALASGETTVPTTGAVYSAVAAKQDKIPADEGKVLTATATDGTTGTLAVDTAVGSGSNLVTNGAVNTALAAKQDKIPAGTAGNVVAYSGTAGTVSSREVATAPASESAALLTAGGAFTALAAKQNTLTLDSSVTSGSGNPVTGGAVYTALAAVSGAIPDVSGKQDKLPAGANKAFLGTATAGTTAFTTGTLAIAASGLTVGESGKTGAVTVESAGTSATKIVGPDNGTATLADGTMQVQVAAGTAGTVLAQSGTAGTFSTKATDTAPTASSANLVTSGGVKTALDAKQDKIPANDGKVLTATATAGLTGTLAIDASVSSGSANLVTGGAVYTALAAISVPDVSGKQDKIPAGTSGEVVTYSGTAGTVGSKAVDAAATASSSNLITSGGVKTAVDAKQDKIAAGTGKLVWTSGTAGTVTLTAPDTSVTSGSANAVTGGAVYTAVAAKKATVTRARYVAAADVASGTSLTVPSYIVGSNSLNVYMMGLLCEKDSDWQYEEAGTAGSASTSITLRMDVYAGEYLAFEVIS